MLGMMFLKKGVQADEKSLFFSPGRHQDWLIQAHGVQFDLQQAHDDGLVKMIWIPQPTSLQQADERSAMRAMHNLSQLARLHRPRRVLINDFVPFLQFRSLERFRDTFTKMLQAFDEVDATLFIMMHEAMNEPSQHVIDLMQHQMTGSIHVELAKEGSALNRRHVSLLPGLGHVEHRVIPDWELPRSKGPGSKQRKQKEKPPPRRKRKSRSRKLGSVSDPGAADQIDFASPGDPRPAPEPSRASEAIPANTFLANLTHCFSRRDQGRGSFLLIAIRVEESEVDDASALLETLLPAIQAVLDKGDDVLVDRRRQRLIILMPDKTETDIQDFFDLIQQQLETNASPQGPELLNYVSAIVVPDGRPFVRADDFLAYALDSS